MTTKRHIMIDIETLGTFTNAPVVTIGACFFNPMTGEIGDKFYERIDLAEAMQFGKADPETLRWWLKQDARAQAELVKKGKSAADVLRALTAFYKRSTDGRVWGNGPTFDITILEQQYSRVLGEKAPWPFWNVRDVRTVVDIAEGLVKKPAAFTQDAVAHNALDDCIFQVGYVSQMWQALRGQGSAPAPAPARAEDDDDFL